MEANIERMSDAAKLAECDRQIERVLSEQVDSVVTWAWAGVMILGLLVLFFVAVGAIQAVRYLISLF